MSFINRTVYSCSRFLNSINVIIYSNNSIEDLYKQWINLALYLYIVLDKLYIEREANY